MATYLELSDLPFDISEAYLPYTRTVRQRQKAYAFSRNSYVHRIKLFGDKNRHDIQISAKVYRSRKIRRTA
ncbi:hypothetical protein KUTeg_001120 [Tegillarca granosa]|uniref:Uncharacterized protein n=1 Tax=Tegillarca granosa TaxID=220873 RepID=A0ABQ9FVI1_TEGGR|nr:hypothetical protein KUTeg_001120 [Tegillarca granosa]